MLSVCQLGCVITFAANQTGKLACQLRTCSIEHCSNYGFIYASPGSAKCSYLRGQQVAHAGPNEPTGTDPRGHLGGRAGQAGSRAKRDPSCASSCAAFDHHQILAGAPKVAQSCKQFNPSGPRGDWPTRSVEAAATWGVVTSTDQLDWPFRVCQFS